LHPHPSQIERTLGVAFADVRRELELTALHPLIERRSIDFIPESERTGRLRNQARFWFLTNFQFFVIAIGFVGPSLGLSLGWTILAGTLGIGIGTVFQAFHGAQGPIMGLPQMIQSRAQFGYRGVAVPLIANLVSLVGYNITAAILIGQGCEGMWGLAGPPVGAAMLAIAAVVAVFGHDWVHGVFRLMFWVSLPLFLALSGAILAGHAGGVPHDIGRFNAAAFAAQLAAAASFNISGAPYVSDYTRYLPSGTGRGAVIGSVFVGSGLSAIWLIALGAWLATHMGAADGLVALRAAGDALAPGMGTALALASIGALVATMAMTAYSAMLTTLTLGDCFRPLRPGPRLKAAVVIGLTLLCAWPALTLRGPAVTWVNALLVVLLYALAPWTAVNLIDFFLLRRGHYRVVDLFTPKGIYGAWGARGLLSYAAGFVASLPFFVAPGLYAAPVARSLGGVDIGWLVSLVVSAGAYLLLSARFSLAREAATPTAGAPSP
jgi:purine-cytosine permease-like protein